MNDSPNYHSLNTCARGLKSPGRLSLLTIFIRMSVSALGGISLWPGGCSPPPRCSSNASACVPWQEILNVCLPRMSPELFVPFLSYSAMLMSSSRSQHRPGALLLLGTTWVLCPKSGVGWFPRWPQEIQVGTICLQLLPGQTKLNNFWLHK